ncbi:hypothetical protein LCGC14_0235220 [marine sediment metagenome]|uniref:Calcineurin-like phosphoesterase domain-containing protein n=1 Tax=marine sediment metagenome TaxID=412755 RepID=A0A0F9WTN9_9ZZZZ
MKILLWGDGHLRVRTPQGRTDENFMETCLGKVQQILEICIVEKCDAMIQTGDFFDSPNPNGELVSEVIARLRWQKEELEKCRFFVIHGQHDLSYHTEASMRRSMLAILAAAGVVIPLRVGNGWWDRGDKEHFSGSCFGQEILPVTLTSGNTFEVLVAHVMVGDRPLWPGHDLTGPKQFMRKHPGYDLYVLGDYHYPFSVQVGNIWAINPGAMLRLTRSKRDREHRPKVVIFDTETREPRDIYLNVEPAESVFIEKDEPMEQDEHRFDELVSKLKETGEIGVSFADNLAAHFEADDTPKEIREKILEHLTSGV